MRFKSPKTLLLLLAMLLAVPLHATTAVQLTLGDLVTGSDVIAIGRVTNVASRWADSRTLVTDATIQVSEVLKGDAVSTLTVTLPGGIDANRKFPIAMSYPAAPQMQNDEQVFLFLVSGDEGLAVAGWSQGKFSIISDGTQEYVSRDLTELRLESGSGVVRSGTTTKETLKAFKAAVQQSVKGQ